MIPYGITGLDRVKWSAILASGERNCRLCNLDRVFARDAIARLYILQFLHEKWRHDAACVSWFLAFCCQKLRMLTLLTPLFIHCGYLLRVLKDLGGRFRVAFGISLFSLIFISAQISTHDYMPPNQLAHLPTRVRSHPPLSSHVNRHYARLIL